MCSLKVLPLLPIDIIPLLQKIVGCFVATSNVVAKKGQAATNQHQFVCQSKNCFGGWRQFIDMKQKTGTEYRLFKYRQKTGTSQFSYSTIEVFGGLEMLSPRTYSDRSSLRPIQLSISVTNNLVNQRMK